jgi:predicted nucleic acid-binding protein
VWLQRHTLGAADPSSPLHELVVGLGAGETEAILLAHQIEADWLLTNDAEAQAALDRLAKSSLWISANILSEARAALPKLTEKP